MSAKKAASPKAKVARKKAAKPKVLRGDALRAQATEIHRRLLALYPDAHCELDYRNPYELAVATILSAQCTDKRVNMTPRR